MDLPLIVFTSGVCVSALEMAGLRLLAPDYAPSTLVTAFLVGLLMAKLSLGYWLGDRRRVQFPTPKSQSTVTVGFPSESAEPIRPRHLNLPPVPTDPDPARTDAAYDSILFDRGDALEDLVELYHQSSDDATLRFYAVQLMGFSDAKAAVPHVESALKDIDAGVRAEACRALEDLRARRSVAKLEACMRDEDVQVRRAAREAVRMLGGSRAR